MVDGPHARENDLAPAVKQATDHHLFCVLCCFVSANNGTCYRPLALKSGWREKAALDTAEVRDRQHTDAVCAAPTIALLLAQTGRFSLFCFSAPGTVSALLFLSPSKSLVAVVFLSNLLGKCFTDAAGCWRAFRHGVVVDGGGLRPDGSRASTGASFSPSAGQRVDRAEASSAACSATRRAPRAARVASSTAWSGPQALGTRPLQAG